MKKEYDFSKAKRGAVIAPKGKSRITIYLDDAVLEQFKAQAEELGKGYQTLINDALRESLGKESAAVTPTVLRRILREELAQSEH